MAGACVGALFFGWLTDQFGRKKLFLITLVVYLVATAMTALSFSAWWFFLFRFLTGFGIGGEYAAINSAIDELIPSRHRGRIDIIINGSYWLGAAGGALLTVPLLNNSPGRTSAGVSRSAWAWCSAWPSCWSGGTCRRARAGCSSTAGTRRPRNSSTTSSDGSSARTASSWRSPTQSMTIQPAQVDRVRPDRAHHGGRYPKRTILGFSLFVGQAFLYNAITFGYAQILSTFFKIDTNTGYYFAVIAVGNFLGPLLLGPLFDTIGRESDDLRHLHRAPGCCCSVRPGCSTRAC